MSGEPGNGALKAEQKADIYHKLAVFARARYESARSIEWKINIGLWTLFIVGSGFMVGAAEGRPTIMEAVGVSVISTLVLVAYVWWYSLLHEILQRDNRTSYWWETHLQIMTGTPRPDKLRPRGNWHSAYDDESKQNRDVDFGRLHKMHKFLVAITICFFLLFVGSLWASYLRPAAEAGKSIKTTGAQNHNERMVDR